MAILGVGAGLSQDLSDKVVGSFWWGRFVTALDARAHKRVAAVQWQHAGARVACVGSADFDSKHNGCVQAASSCFASLLA